jgi:hypothetical protein
MEWIDMFAMTLEYRWLTISYQPERYSRSSAATAFFIALARAGPTPSIFPNNSSSDLL